MKSLFTLRNKRVFVAGHNGMVGGAAVRRLQSEGCEILTVAKPELDLRNQEDVGALMAVHKPDVVILAAARVGGIRANMDFPADFLYDNLMIEANVIHAAYKNDIEKLLFIGSSCIYPKFAVQPIDEKALLTGALEPTNEAYAIAKIAGIELCRSYRRQYGCDFISVMPCNLYGPGDTYEADRSHVIPALIMKLHEAKENVSLWGTGTPLREFLYVDDFADALVFLLKNYSEESHINVGSGVEVTISDLAQEIADVTGYKGIIGFDPAMPDGTPRKLMDGRRMNALGWQPQTTLRMGLRNAYADYLKRVERCDAA